MKFELMNKVGGLLSKPGDTLFACITDTGRKVVKICSEQGKVSAVQYPNGTTVVTKVLKGIGK